MGDAAPILFAGDPHRNFAPILRACAARPPGTLILLGDCDLPAPLDQVFCATIGRGWDIRWILGNRGGMPRRNPLVEYVASETSLFGKFAE